MLKYIDTSVHCFILGIDDNTEINTQKTNGQKNPLVSELLLTWNSYKEGKNCCETFPKK